MTTSQQGQQSQSPGSNSSCSGNEGECIPHRQRGMVIDITQNNHSIIIEQPSPLATSKSNSSRGGAATTAIYGNDIYTPKNCTTNSIENTPNTDYNNDMLMMMMMTTNNSIIQKMIQQEHNCSQNCQSPGSNQLQNLYQSTLDWMLNREPSNLNQSPMLDDADSICFQEALSILLPLVLQGDSFLKQKALQDLINLARWNQTNASILINYRLFHQWLLQLLLPLYVRQEGCSLANTKTQYLQIVHQQQQMQQSQQRILSGALNNSQYNTLNAKNLAICDMGRKLHTILLKTAISNERDGYKRVNFILRWRSAAVTNLRAAINSTQQQQQQGTSSSQQQAQQQQQQAAFIATTSGLAAETRQNGMHKLVNNLWTLCSSSLYESCALHPAATQEHPLWKNLAHSAGLVEEFVLCNNQEMEEIKQSQQFGTGGVLDYVFGGDFIGGQTNSLRAKGSCLQHVVEKLRGTIAFKTLSAGNSSSSSIVTTKWADLEMVSQFLRLFDPIWNLRKQYAKKSASAADLHTQQMLFSSDKSNLKPTTSLRVLSPNSSNLLTPQDILIFMQNASVEHFSPTLKLLLQQEIQSPSSSESLLQQQHQRMMQNSGITQHFPLKSIINLMCLGIAVTPYTKIPNSPLSSQPQSLNFPESSPIINNNNDKSAGTQQNTLSQQLQRLQNCVIFLMMSSQIWRFKQQPSFFHSGQKKIANQIAFVLTFLFHQIHRQTSSSQNQGVVGSHERVKIIQQSLKNILVTAFNVLHFGSIRRSPSQLHSGRLLPTAVNQLFSQNLLRFNDVENLFSPEKISDYNKMQFDEFPECFHQPKWKNLFFSNDKLEEIVKYQINAEHLAVVIVPRRQAYRQNLQNSIASNERVRQDIMNRVHGEVMEVITKESEKVYQERNVNLLLQQQRRRTRSTLWRKTWKRLVLWRGVWRDKRLFDVNDNEKLPLKYSGFQTFDKGKPIMSVRMKNVTHLIPAQDVQPANSSINNSPNKNISDNNKRCIIKDLNTIFSNSQQISQIYESLSYSLPQCQSSSNPVYNKPILRARQIQALKHNFANIIFQNIFVTKRKQKKLLQLPCQIIKSLNVIRGILYITNHDIKFFIDITQHPCNSNISNTALPFPSRSNIAFFQYQHPNDKQFTLTWPLSYVRELQRRRFLGKKSATQMFLIDNRSVLLNFASVDDRNLFTKKIVRLRDKKCLNLRYHQTLEPKKILKKADFATAWSEWRISNFQYLMMLNALAGRSYHDLSQYPVFPWIITDYISPILNCGNGSIYRPLSMNLAMMGDEKRRNDYIEKYNNFDTKQQFKPVWGDIQPYHFGSHYSNPGVVLHFLQRMMPMIQGSIALHDGKIDLPQRSFYSVAQSFKSVSCDQSDFRELIPEFYQLPEIFMNRNRINFGKKMGGQEVDNVELPQWCMNDPYKFVITLREILESEIVSQQLHHWIDLIFGYQQTGKEAEKAMNKFHPLTYQDAILDIDKITPDMERQSIQIQIYNFGQTPGQLFTKTHNARNQKRAALKYRLVVDQDSRVKVFRPVAGNPSSKSTLNRQNSTSSTSRQQISASAVLIAKFVSESKIVGVINNSKIVSYLWWPHAHDMNPNTPFTLCATQQPKTYNAQTRIGGFQTSDRTFFRFDQLICILSQGKFIARGGFWDGKIVVSPIADTQASVTYVSHHSTVTAMAVESKQRFVITGAKQGDVIVWNILSTQGQHWVIHKHVHDHTAPVMSISICQRMLMFATVGLDGCCNIYSLIKGKLLRSITHPKMHPLLAVALSSSPLPSVAIFSEKDRQWNSFSLNGKRLGSEKQDGKHVVAPLIIRNSTFLDRLVYGNQRGEVVIRKMPYLETIRRNQVAIDAPVLTLLVDPTRRFLLVGCGDGGLQVITDPLKIQSSGGGKILMNQSNISSSSNNQRGSKARESVSSSTGSVGSSIRQSLVAVPLDCSPTISLSSASNNNQSDAGTQGFVSTAAPSSAGTQK